MNLTLQLSSDNCYQCLFRNVSYLSAGFSVSDKFLNYTKDSTIIRFYSNQTNSVIQQYNYQLAENTKYLFIFNQIKQDEFILVQYFQGESAYYNKDRYIPLYILVLTILCLIIFRITLYKWALYKYKDKLNNRIRQLLVNEQQEDNKQKRRLKSLDCFRGMTIMLMILVNYKGGEYQLLSHSYYNGITIADLVFPFFIYIMGVTIGILNNKLIVNRSQLLYQSFLRSLKLFFIGLLLINNCFDLANCRIMGVLQKASLNYIIFISLILLFPSSIQKPPNKLHTQNIQSKPDEEETLRINKSRLPSNQLQIQPLIISDQKQDKPQRNRVFVMLKESYQLYIVIHLILVFFILIQYTIGFGDCPAGYNGAGGISEQGKFRECTGGISNYIDQLILSKSHIFSEPFGQYIYDIQYQDPEGLLSTLSSLYLVFIGYQSALILNYYTHSDNVQIYKLVFSNSIFIVFYGILGGVLCNFQQEGGLIPANKNVWSISFVFITASLAQLSFLLFYLFIDYLNLFSGFPFYYVGQNSILIYAGHELLANYFPFSYLNDHSHSQVLLSNSLALIIWNLIAYILFINNIFLKL